MAVIVHTEATAEVQKLTRHFFKCMGSNSAHAPFTADWLKSIQSLLDTHKLTAQEMTEFMTWATSENTDPKPQFNSVVYLAAASDPMKSLVKNAESLIRVWRAKQKARSVVDTEDRPPIPGRDPWLDTPAGKAWAAEQLRKYPMKKLKLS